MSILYRNRRLLLLVVMLIVATGLYALSVLPRQEDPKIQTRFAFILTQLPGASAERVEALVTEPIEREMREMEEVKELISTSRAGTSAVNIELREDIEDLDPVWSRVRDRLDDLMPQFPPGTRKPDLRDRDVIDTLTLIAGLRWTGEGEPNYAILRRIAEQVRDEIRAVEGTAFVKLYGAPDEEVRVEIDRHTAAVLGLTPGDIAARIRGSDAKVTAGLVRSAHGDLNIEVSGELDSLERIRNLVLGVGPDGQTVVLRDLARLQKTIQDPPDELAILDRLPGVAIGARMRDTERTDLWAAAVREVIEAHASTLPSELDLSVLFDQSTYVEDRLSSLLKNLLLGVLFVVVVTFILMGWRSAIVVGLTLPLASLMVFTGLNLLDVPVEQMSIMGLIIALGMLIDNAIIMTDEVGHELRSGTPPTTAIQNGVRFLMVPLLGSTLTTILAFMPMVLIQGATGEFIRSIAISVILAISSSLILALTVVPTFVAMLGPGRRGPTWLRAGIQPAFLERPYRALLRVALHRPLLGMLFALALPVLGFLMASRLPEQFFPPAERDQLRIEIELPPQAPLEQTYAMAQAVDEALREDPLVTHVHWLVGRNAPKFYYNMMTGREGSPNYAEAMVQLSESQKAVEKIRALQKDLDRRFPEALVLVRILEQGPPFDTPVELRIFGPDLEELQRLGEEARRILAQVPDVTHTKTSIAGSRPKLHVKLDEASLRRTGLVNTQVAAQLYASLEGVEGGSFLEGTEELPVFVRLERGAREEVDDITSVDLFAPVVPGRPRRPIPLSAVARLVLEPEEGAITRRDAERYNSVGGLVTAGVLPSTVLSRFQEALEEADFRVPHGYRMTFGGEQEERNEAVTKLLASVAVLLISMITVLVLSFGSFRLAGLILSIGGLSIGLSLFALWVFDQNFGFMAIVGTMGLVGLAINDSIAVLASLRKNARVAAGDLGAAEDTVFRATRHVLSTTLTTMAGFLPLILAGGLLWPPLAISIAGGVAGATVLALFFLPPAYCRLSTRRAPSPS